jgi:glyoxylase-like metal-dependent hydrolase (beta-lactamase superfamily II)
MNLREIAPGLRYWTAPHPEWRSAADWPEDVGCVWYEATDAIVLIDPLIPRDEQEAFWAMLDKAIEQLQRPVSVLLTAPWHKRNSALVADRYGTTVWSHRSDPTRLPAGIELFVPGGVSEGQVAFFLRPHRALVVAEIFAGADDGLRVCASPASSDLEAFDKSLQALLDLPIDHVLVSHGEPVLHDGRRRIAEALGVHA